MFVDDEIQSAGAAGRVADANGDIEQAERHLYLAMIKRHIEANIGADSLAADDLPLSHVPASLYRLFGPDGGLARYVREQRLNVP